ncbi:unnamed protein product [Chrysoparadoxa australica]
MRLLIPRTLIRRHSCLPKFSVQARLSSSVDDAEIKKFGEIKESWWDSRSSKGAAPLHSMNITRVKYITDHLHQPIKGLKCLDVGCGGGLLCESLARLEGDVMGIDPSQENINVAREHAAGDNLTRGIDYQAKTVEELDSEGVFDLVCALEVLEHVNDVNGFIKSLARQVKPGGTIAISTINKTPKSFALAIVAAEYIAGLVPRGTHDWNKFIPPEEVNKALSLSSIDVVDQSGMVYNPFCDRWHLDQGDMDVNYILVGRKHI